MRQINIKINFKTGNGELASTAEKRKMGAKTNFNTSVTINFVAHSMFCSLYSFSRSLFLVFRFLFQYHPEACII